MLVVVAHIKGGTGKTTVATQLALQRQISHPERRVWLIDGDEQQSALDTMTIRAEQELKPEIACAAYTKGKQLATQLRAQASQWDDIVIDCGGKDSDLLRVALLAADKLIVPVLPRSYDVWALSRMETVMASAKDLGAEFEAFALINRFDNSADCRDAQKLIDENEKLTRMSAVLSDRRSYGKAGGMGKAMAELKPLDKKAADEISALEKEVFGD